MPLFFSKKRFSAAYIAKAAVIAACYAVLTIILAPFGYGQIQFRISEALCVLPFIMPEAIFGLFVGCIIANLFSSNILILDVVFGSLATLGAAVCTALCVKLGKKGKWLAPLPPVIFNAIIISAVIAFSVSQNINDAFSLIFIQSALTIGLSEFIITYLFGLPLLILYEKYSKNSRKG